jgi:hypothetical protein
VKRPEDRKIYWIDPRLPPEEYDRQWIAGIKARCIVNENGCWIWQRCCQPFRNMKPGQRGYPGAAYRSKGVRAHRKMLEIKLGKLLPPELHACHTCDTPPCCNPDHLYAATNSQNHLDGGKRGRMQGQWKTHCKNGHEFNEENTYWSPRPNGSPVRNCKVCQRDCQRKRYQSNRALHNERNRVYRQRRKERETQNV